MSGYSDKSNKKKNLTIVISIASVLIAILVGVFTYLVLEANTDKAYAGVMVGSLDLGGKTKSEAVSLLEKAYPADDINVKLDCDGTVFDLYGSSIGLKVDYEATADDAVSYGKEGFLFKKISNMLETKKNIAELDLVISCDYNVLQYTLNENLGDKIEDVQNYTVEIGEDELIISNGKPGRIVPAQRVIDSISQAIVGGTLSDTMKLSIEDVSPEPINIDNFIEEYNRDPQDASVEEDGDEINIIPEVVGVKINEEEARKILAENSTSDKTYTIPAQISHPEVTAAELEAEYTDTVIATYRTDYSTSSGNRKTNIALASSKINGLILNPGQVFSFNDVVGPRTAATGYKVAHVYSGSKVVDGIGGGICQVSSTLYNAVVLADLEIVYRTNHSLPVSYVPLGRDATVSYGSIDFKFKNNKATPIKFELIADGSYLTVNVYGRKKYIKDISVETSILGSIPYSTQNIEDPSLPAGETVVEEGGSNGTRVEAYKVVKENGTVVSRTLLAKSTYSPSTRVVRVGTGEPEPETDPLAPADGQTSYPGTDTTDVPQLPDVYADRPDIVTPSPETPESPVPPVEQPPVETVPVAPAPAPAAPEAPAVAEPVPAPVPAV